MRSFISFSRVLRRTLDLISPLGSERISLMQAVGRVTAGDLNAWVDVPSGMILTIPEGTASISAGSLVHVQLLPWSTLGSPIGQGNTRNGIE